MRDIISNAIANTAINDDKFILLTGDHGYSLFDKLRQVKSEQFLNVGIMEQAMIGIASGLAKTGYKPMCYGLSSFMPLRCLEQIKFNICLANLPVKLIGDGAGLVYSTLGNSHLCAEDIACLSPLPNIDIYSPGDAQEMSVCFQEFYESEQAGYLRIGKADNPQVNTSPLYSTEPYYTNRSESDICFVSTGSMIASGHLLAKEFGFNHLSIMKLKPLSTKVTEYLKTYHKIFVFEEHSSKGGLLTQIIDQFIYKQIQMPIVKSFSLKNSFIKKCGGYQYALSEHGLDYASLKESIKNEL